MNAMRASPPRICRSILACLALAALLLAAPASRAETLACGAPADQLDAAPMPGVTLALSRRELRVLVVGSASTQGGGTSGAEATWPERLKALLAQRVSPVTVRLEVFGERGTTALDHARVIAEQAPALRPHLVIWQLGTVEAARGLPVSEMAETVEATLERLSAVRGERTDVVLMDPQYSRFLRSNADVEAYRDGLRVAAAASGAQVFSRWAVMRAWVESGTIDLERAGRRDRVAVADRLHDCLAQALTAFILDGAAWQPSPAR